MDDEAEKFAHVFAIIAQWGIGKSRLAYELMSQINDTSPGWYVRDASGNLSNAQLFHDNADRDQYLGLYIRYSQVATESHNIDNWFAYCAASDCDVRISRGILRLFASPRGYWSPRFAI